MVSYSLVISPIARDDLKNIYQFSRSKWGEVQSEKYIDALKEQLWAIVEQPNMGIEREKLLSNMRSFSVESHIIFYRLKTKQIEIVRILHGKQDPQRHIK